MIVSVWLEWVAANGYAMSFYKTLHELGVLPDPIQKDQQDDQN